MRNDKHFWMKHLLIHILITSCLPLMASARIGNTLPLDSMLSRYWEYRRSGKIPAGMADENLVVRGQASRSQGILYCPYRSRYGIKDFCTTTLRTKEFPDKKHFWTVYSVIEKENGRTTPTELYLALDSVESVDTWTAPFTRKYSRSDGAMHYANLSGTMSLLVSPFNMLGFTVSTTLDTYKLKHGRILEWESEGNGLIINCPNTTLDASLTMRIQHAMRKLSEDVNQSVNAGQARSTRQTYDLMILTEPDGRQSTELLSVLSGDDSTYNELKHIIQDLLPRHYFSRLWLTNGTVLPGFYIEAKLENGRWSFSMDKFVKELAH